MKTLYLSLSLALLLAGPHGAAHAGLIKCKKPGGGFTLQDMPCAPDAGKSEARRPVVGEKDPEFAKKSRPGANWEQRTMVETPRPPYIPPPQIAPRPEAAPAVSYRPSAAQQPQSRAANAEVEAYNQSVMAQNRVTACRNARVQLDIVNRNRPIYSANDKGEKVYVEDKDREAVAARAQREVAGACN